MLKLYTGVCLSSPTPYRQVNRFLVLKPGFLSHWWRTSTPTNSLMKNCIPSYNPSIAKVTTAEDPSSTREQL